MSRLVRQTERYFRKLLALAIALVFFVLLVIVTYWAYVNLVSGELHVAVG